MKPYLILLILTSNLFAYNCFYGPFETNELPKQIPVVKYECATTNDGILTAFPEYTRYSQIYSGLFNDDNKIDYAIVQWLGGCGLASEYNDITFLLSSNSTYCATKITTMSPGTEDFVIISGKKCWIRTTFINGPEDSKGKVHNYFVYSLMKFNGAQITYANELSTNFPKWIWYTNKPNHKSTDKLTEKQKRMLWEEQGNN